MILTWVAEILTAVWLPITCQNSSANIKRISLAMLALSVICVLSASVQGASCSLPPQATTALYSVYEGIDFYPPFICARFK